MAAHDPRGKRITGSFYTTYVQQHEVSTVEEVPCNLCGSSARTAIDEEDGFGILRCRDCGLVYVSPQPTQEELPKFYESLYDVDDAAETAEIRSLGLIERQVAEIVQRLKPEGGRLLDIGCGYGQFLSTMASDCWDLTGLELSESAAAHAVTAVPSATIQQGDIDSADFPDEHFDCIVLIAVMEHFKDPKAALARYSKWLKPGGVVVMVVPYITAFIQAQKFLPASPIRFEAPRHLFDFSPKTLPRYLREAGYTNVKCCIGRPYASPTKFGLALIWLVKLVGYALHALTFGRYVYPFASSIVVYGEKE
jgi:SAM-dependent methyltransferase